MTTELPDWYDEILPANFESTLDKIPDVEIEQDTQSPQSSNVSHGILAGNMNIDVHSKVWVLEDGELVLSTDDDWPDGYFIGNRTSKTASQSLTKLSSHIEDDGAWMAQSGMGYEGLLLPCAVEFVQRSPKGVDEEYYAKGGARPDVDGGAFSPFEQPNSKLMNWQTPPLDEDEKIRGLQNITSVTLNPFVHGHHVSTMLRGSKVQNLQINKQDATYVAPFLGDVPTPQESQRPVGLRGPMIVTGWGYDTEDFPVPNAKMEAMFKDSNPKSETFSLPTKELDDLKEKNPKLAFLNHHLQRIDQWKSGPVDLRWDRERKVWVSPGANKVYLCKAAKCILPTAGPDGKNSWNWGVAGTTSSPGRQYRNPCPDTNCTASTYFPTSPYFPDIEIYDPEDQEWCGKCSVKLVGKHKTPMVNCDEFNDACVPFYDAIVVKSMGHITSGKVKSDCGDKYKRTTAGPSDRRVGDPCHGWGVQYMEKEEYLGDIMDGGKNPKYSDIAASILHRKIFIENPLSQGLMLGDAFLSYDTGRRLSYTYERRKDKGACGVAGDTITVTETVPVHVILQAEFFGVEVVQSVACQQGELGSCTRKIFAQGMATPMDCGPDDDYPSTAIY